MEKLTHCRSGQIAHSWGQLTQFSEAWMNEALWKNTTLWSVSIVKAICVAEGMAASVLHQTSWRISAISKIAKYFLNFFLSKILNNTNQNIDQQSPNPVNYERILQLLVVLKERLFFLNSVFSTYCGGGSSNSNFSVFLNEWT